MWCELWLPQDSPLNIEWHLANVSRAVGKPHDGDDCWESRDKGLQKKKKNKSEAWEMHFCDVAPLIVPLIIWLFASPVAFKLLNL